MGVAIAVGAVVLIFSVYSGSEPTVRVSVVDVPTVTPTASPIATPVATTTPRPHSAPLDGVYLSDSEWELRRNRRPLAIVVDNAAGGVPQAGLDQADLVYETFVEGGLTRFLAVFWRRDAESVFPVRSVRTPFVIWASELDALLGHGGSAQTDNEANAGGQILEWDVPDLDAFQPPATSAYRRLGDRFAPYNLAVSTLLLRQVAAEAGFERSTIASRWEFVDDRTRSSTGISAGGIEVSFRSQRTAGELIQWRWDPLANDYVRYQWGGVHPILPGLQPLRFKNVVVMRVPLQVVDASGHTLLELLGEGPAQVFLDGVVIEGTWRKANRTARTRFHDRAGKEIPFNRGPIMIEAVSPTSPVSFTTTASGLAPLPDYAPPTFAIADASADRSPTPSPSPSETPTPIRLPTLPPTATPTPAPPTATRAPTLTPTPTPTPTMEPPPPPE